MTSRNSSVTRSDLALAFFGAVALFLVWAVRSVFMLVAFALLLAYGLDPVVRRLERLSIGGWRVRRRPAAALIIVSLVVVLGLAIAWGAPLLASQVAAFLERLPGQISKLAADLRDRAPTSPWAGQLAPALDNLSDDAGTIVPQLAGWVLRGAASVLARLQQVLGLLLLPVLTFYVITDGRQLRDALIAFLPKPVATSIVESRGRMHKALQSYVRGQAIVCFVMGTTTGLALGIARMPDVLLLGLLAGLAEIVPVIGATLAALTIFLSGLSLGLPHALLGLGIYLAINWSLGVFVTPRVMGRELKLHPFLIMVSVLAGAQLLGPPGAILALPIAAVLQALVADVAGERRSEVTTSEP